MVKVTYIRHDGFLVETDRVNIVFDYWVDADGEDREIPRCLEKVDHAKPLYVLVSHGHKDHFNRKIFSWAERFTNIRYIVSSDVMKRIRHIVSESSVYRGPKVEASKVTMLRPGEAWDDREVVVRAFPSTDIGNSYMVTTDGLRFFHAGDLNAWIWKDESTEQEVRKALGDFRACLHDIKEYLLYIGEDMGLNGEAPVDYAFFPVDSRIGRDYFTGAAEFVKEVDVKRFFPMHFALGDEEEQAQRIEDALRFDLYANELRGEYIPLALPGSTYINSNKH